MNQEKAFNHAQLILAKPKRERLPKVAWKKPQLTQLHISLDTAFSGGSNIDLVMTGSVSP